MADVSVIGTSSSIDGFSCDGPQQAGENEMGGNYQKARMLSQEQASTDGCDWHRTVLGNIKARLVDDQEFPCIFGRSAIRKGILKFIFVESVDPAGIRHLADGLVEYVECSKGWDGNLNTASPLVVAFSLDAIRDGSWADYHAFGWSVLQKLHEIDPMPWPQDVATDPHSPSWSMCFNGMQLFCNMSHPAHKVRRSRNLGAHFLFVINPRERFDVVAGNNPTGRKVRNNIRDRIAGYDGVPRSLQLGSYGSGGLEWWQYGIIEDNVERTDKCPFAFAGAGRPEDGLRTDERSPAGPAANPPAPWDGGLAAD